MQVLLIGKSGWGKWGWALVRKPCWRKTHSVPCTLHCAGPGPLKTPSLCVCEVLVNSNDKGYVRLDLSDCVCSIAVYGECPVGSSTSIALAACKTDGACRAVLPNW